MSAPLPDSLNIPCEHDRYFDPCAKHLHDIRQAALDIVRLLDPHGDDGEDNYWGDNEDDDRGLLLGSEVCCRTPMGVLSRSAICV